MNLDNINKQRKNIVILSVILTILSLAISVAVIVYGFLNNVILASTSGFVLIVVLLYVVAKFIIIPKYNNLKIEIFRSFFNNYQINNDKYKFKELDNYFNKNKTKVSNTYKIDNENISFTFATYEEGEKKALKGTYLLNAGYVCKIKMNKSLPNQCFIGLNSKQTEKFIRFYSDTFKNRNDNITTSKKFKPFVCLYDGSYNLKLIDCFEHIDGFNFINIKEDEILFISSGKRIEYDFKLQDKLSNNDLVNYKNQYKQVIRMFDKINEFVGDING